MGFFLLDNPNPNGPNYYAAEARKLAAVIHITAGLQDLDGGGDNSCEATCRYAATTTVDVSWHGGSDTDTYVYLLPPRYVAWHVLGYNTATYGWEISKSGTDWRNMPAWWVENTLRRAAEGLRPVLRELGIPIRKATRAELDHAIATGGAPVGLISHAELQPSDRTDPGWVRGTDTFPWGRFLELLRGDAPEPQTKVDHDMPVLIKGRNRPEVFSVSSTAKGYHKRHVGTSEWLVLTAAGVPTHVVNQVDVDAIPGYPAVAPAVPVLLIKGDARPDVFSVSSTADGFGKRHVTPSEFAVLSAAGARLVVARQADVDGIPPVTPPPVTPPGGGTETPTT